MVTRLQALIGEINNYCEWGKIKPLRLNRDAEDLTIQGIKEIFDWFAIEANEAMNGMRTVRRLCSEEIWKRYDMHNDCHKLAEMRLRADAVAKFNKTLRAGKLPSVLERYVA
jgi:hypothetical protein